MGPEGVIERRRFIREFKLEAVRLIRDRGVLYAQASQDLKVHPTQVRNWVKAFADDPRHAFPGQGQLKPEQLESGSNDGHTLTSGTFGTVPRRGGVSSPRGPYGLRRDVDRRFLARRGSGSFSGRGFTGPSG
jgi:hypothetical protein